MILLSISEPSMVKIPQDIHKLITYLHLYHDVQHNNIGISVKFMLIKGQQQHNSEM